MSALQDLRAATGFLTSLGKSPPAPTPATLRWFPPVGAAMGWALGKAWQQSRRHWGSLPAAALVVSGDCLLTGALHLDGLADSADGLLAHLPAKSRLEMMAEPQVGSFGVMALLLSSVCRTSALASSPPSPAMLAALYCSSRTMMAIATQVLPYARDEGLVTAFLVPETADGGRGRPADPRVVAACAAGAMASLVTASAARGRSGLAAIVAGWSASIVVLELARRRIGGFTGDVLGAAGAVGETVALVALSARSKSGTA